MGQTCKHKSSRILILLANSLRLLPLHCVERAGVRPPPFGYCWRTLSVCSLSTQWRGLGQESSGGALQRPPPFGFANSIRKDGDPKEPGSSTPPSSTEPSFGRAAAY